LIFKYCDGGGDLVDAAAFAGHARLKAGEHFLRSFGFGKSVHGCLLDYEKTSQFEAAKNRRKKLLRPLRVSERVGLHRPLFQSFSF
jgi:hypothetical protein